MKIFLKIFKTSLLEEFQYKGAFISGIICQIAFGFMYIFLYTAFFENGVPQNFNQVQMASYIWLGQAFFAMFGFFDLNRKEITSNIKNGNVSYQLTKPISLYDHWFYIVLATGISKVLVRCIPMLIIAFLLPKTMGLSLPFSFVNFLLFIVAIVLGFILVSAVKMLAYLLILYTLNDRGVMGIVSTVCAFLSGLYVPLPLLPEKVQFIFNFFPFRYSSDLSYRIYIGNINPSQAIFQIGIQIVWIFILILIGKLLYARKSRNLVLQGG